MGVFDGLGRREDNHQAWEDRNPGGAVRARARHALDLRVQREAERANARLALRVAKRTARVRNNRREY